MHFGHSFTQQKCFGRLKMLTFENWFQDFVQVQAFENGTIIVFLLTTKTHLCKGDVFGL